MGFLDFVRGKKPDDKKSKTSKSIKKDDKVSVRCAFVKEDGKRCKNFVASSNSKYCKVHTCCKR